MTCIFCDVCGERLEDNEQYKHTLISEYQMEDKDDIGGIGFRVSYVLCRKHAAEMREYLLEKYPSPKTSFARLF
jgi:hypothetical protein